MSLASCHLTLTSTSPAAATTAVGSVDTRTSGSDLSGYSTMLVEALLTGATGGTLDVYLQSSYDGGVTWTDYAHFPQIAAGAAAAYYTAVATRATAAGSFSSIRGHGTSPTLTANVMVGGEWGDRMRVLYVSGAGTSAGASQTIKLFLSTAA